MNWIKQNPFLSSLIGITAVLAIVLFVIGFAGRGRYSDALTSYQETSEEVARYERSPLYPESSLRDSKRKFLGDYREAVSELQEAFDPYRAAELEDISPQEFTNRLIAANEEVQAAAEESGMTLPDRFFLGFEDYSAGTLARQSATGILNFQLGAIRELMVALGEAGPDQLLNLHRPKLPEEDGSSWERGEGQVARELPLEVSFVGSEESVRQFMSALVGSENHFYVIRTLRIGSEKQSPPLAGDAKFDPADSAGAGAGAAPAAADPFAGFVFPGEEGADEEGADDAGEEAAAEPAAPAQVPGDTSRILGQVLGTENVQVFLRLDILQFLAPLELPQP